MENSLSLKEKFMLLSYHPEKGKPYWDAQYYMYGVIGAILLELAGQNKIKVEEKQLIVADTKKTGDTALDYVVEILASSGKQKKVQSWIQSFSSFRSARTIKKLILQQLVDKRTMGEEEGRFLFFTFKKYPLRDTRTRFALLKNIQDFVLKGYENDRDAALLASLVGSTQLTSRVFEKADRKAARKKLKQISKENEVSKIVGATVSAVQAAIVASVAVTASVSAASGR